MILILSISLFLGFLIGYFIKHSQIREKNQEIEKEEFQAQLRIKELEKQYAERQQDLIVQENKIVEDIQQKKFIFENECSQKLLNWQQQENNLKTKVVSLESQINEKQQAIDLLIQQTNSTINEIIDKSFDAAVSQYENKIFTEEQKYNQATTAAHDIYIDMLNTYQHSYLTSVEEKQQELLKLNQQLEEAKAKAVAAIECNKRAELDKQQKDFYKLQLTNIDLEEIAKIKSIEPYLRQKEPLNKVIWKVYYEKPTTDLIGRVIGQKVKTGIYKITNIRNGMCYVGQAVNIAERWKQHIKRGIGADPPTQNKLYPAMLSIGVENFTFEIIEECSGIQLTEREKYWTDFYQAQSYGYVVRKG